MRIELDDAKRGPIPWSETLDLGANGSGSKEISDAGVTSLGPIEHQGELAFAEPNYRLRGSLSYKQQLSCYRCLVDFGNEVSDDFEYLLERSPFKKPKSAENAGEGDVESKSSEPMAPVSAGAEIELSPDDLEVLSVDSDHIDTTFYIREQVLLHVPMKPLCTAECKGLCSQCGIDRNQGECDCTAAPGDPRWAGLAALKDQLDS